MNNVGIYLISLKNDHERRKILQERFLGTYSIFEHIEAIDGREIKASDFYKKTIDFNLAHKRLMSPSELGCTLSHIKALESFLASNKEIALIIEDDILGDDKDVFFILNTLKKIKNNSIVFCGCQDGLMNRYKYGYIIGNDFLKVPLRCYGNFSRTAAYAVTRDAAEKILQYHYLKKYTIADFWFEILKNSNINLYYISRLKHPTNLDNSAIENDRKIFEKKIWRKVFSLDFFPLVYRRLRNEFFLYLYKINGVVNIENIK